MHLDKNALAVICKARLSEPYTISSNNNDILHFHGALIVQEHSMLAVCSLTSLGQEILALCPLFCLEF